MNQMKMNKNRIEEFGVKTEDKRNIYTEDEEKKCTMYGTCFYYRLITYS